jgi:lipopolysaccharide transport system permease protein
MNNYKYLYLQWFKRDVAGRYRGSVLGLLWPLLQPLIQIAVFTLIFFEFMKMRWPMASGESTALGYGLNVFAGLAVFNFFSEVLGRSPIAILSQPNLVTKVRFPLFILPAVTVGSALIHIVVGSAVLIAVSAIYKQLSWTAVWLPVILLPLITYAIALALLLSSLGVYLRDIAQIMPSVTSVLMFLTPIFYPSSSIPLALRPLFEINPIAWGAQSVRDILLNSVPPDFASLGGHTLAAFSLLAVAVVTFKYLEKGFSDVL